jgi:hypothetical protein
MKSIKLSRIVVVGDNDHGHLLAARLRRMEAAMVTAVNGLEEARQLCQLGCADACLVAIDSAIPDGVPVTASDAPGRFCGIPALMVAAVITPHLRRTARQCGYLAAVSAALPPRMLYRRIGAALQGRRSARMNSRHTARVTPPLSLPKAAVFAKPTLH